MPTEIEYPVFTYAGRFVGILPWRGFDALWLQWEKDTPPGEARGYMKVRTGWVNHGGAIKRGVLLRRGQGVKYIPRFIGADRD